MNLIYASTFADALAKLSHPEQKQVKITTVDLMMDLKGSGLSLERINRAADTDMWSARVSRDLRIILKRDSEEIVLAYVGHHNDAYAWAERRKITRHERTGAMQIVEVIEQKAEGKLFNWTEGVATNEPAPVGQAQPFWSLSDDDMLDVGVPRDWLQPVREMVEDELDRLFDHLPAEAAEALYDYATGGKLSDHKVQPATVATNAFAHPDSQRRFRVLDNIEELQAALDAPFEKWAVFLHPAQRALVEKPATGPTRVTGSAGTGKTIVALHRAVHLAEQDHATHVLLTTFSAELSEALAKKLAILTEATPSLRERIDVRPLDEAVIELYASVHGHPAIADEAEIAAIVDTAKTMGLGGDLSREFLSEEWTELVDAWGVDSADSYANIPRTGRRTRLGPKQREAAWAVFEHIRSALSERGLLTPPMIYSALADLVRANVAMPFAHVVVDEAQDLTVPQVRFLGEVAGLKPDAVFLAGDIGQRIFRLPFSWVRLGLDIRGRSHSLKVNYRTSHQIRTMADRLLPPSITDSDGLEEGRLGTVSVFDGPEPALIFAEDEEAESELVGSWIRDCVVSGIAPSEIGVLVRSELQFPRAEMALHLAELGEGGTSIRRACMHVAKGL